MKHLHFSEPKQQPASEPKQPPAPPKTPDAQPAVKGNDPSREKAVQKQETEKRRLEQ